MQKTTHVPSFLCSRLDEKIGLITHLSPGPGLQQPVFQCLHRRLTCVAAQQQAEGGIRPERSLHKARPRPVWVARLVVPVRLSALSVLLCQRVIVWDGQSAAPQPRSVKAGAQGPGSASMTRMPRCVTSLARASEASSSAPLAAE